MYEVVVPNPKKEIRTNYPIDEVRKVIKELPTFVNTAKLIIDNDTMNYYQFEAQGSNVFSFGLYLDICLHEISPTQTALHFEGRRKIGWINSTAEITETYNYISGCINMIGKGLRGELVKK